MRRAQAADRRIVAFLASDTQEVENCKASHSALPSGMGLSIQGKP